MGVKISKTNSEVDVIEIEVCSKRQRVFHYHLSKYEFPPKPQFSHNNYVDNLTKDYGALENEYNLAIQAKH